MKQKKGNPPTSMRGIRFEQMREVLASVGYDTWRIHMPRIRVAAMLMLACNQIAAAKNIDNPYVVYNTLRILLLFACRGSIFTPKHVHSLWDKVRLAGDNAAKLDVCPCCGRPLPFESKEDLDDLDFEKLAEALGQSSEVTNKVTTI